MFVMFMIIGNRLLAYHFAHLSNEKKPFTLKYLSSVRSWNLTSVRPSSGAGTSLVSVLVFSLILKPAEDQ